MKAEPLYKQIQEKIKNKIQSGELRPGDRVPSEKELAQQYHVSQITSKNALIGLADEGIVERIKGKGTFIKKNNKYSAAAPLAEFSYKGIIGLIIPTMKTQVDQQLLNYIEKYVRANGYELIIRITRESQIEETNAVNMFRQLNVKGLIIFPTEKATYNEAILKLTIDQFPLVLIDRYLENINTYSVSSENLNGTYEAISYLLDKGHENIGLISRPNTNTATNERISGFEKAFLDKDLNINKNLWCLLDFDIISKQATETIGTFLKDRPGVTAVFSMNAELAKYTYTAVREIGKQVPQDIEIVSFDPTRNTAISYIQQNVKEISKTAVRLLVKQLNDEYEPERLFIPVEFVTASSL